MSESKQRKSRVLVTTDMEPDDMLGIYAACRLGQLKISAFLVGEGNATMKHERMTRYMKLLAQESFVSDLTIVIHGDHSKNEFTKDGAEFELKAVEAKTVNEDHVLAACLGLCPAITIWVLKPPRELLRLHQKSPELFAEVELVVYGSFNFRSVLDRKNPKGSRQILYDLFASCKRVVIYESFLSTKAGSANNITPDNAPAVCRALASSKSEYVAAVMRLVKAWNEHNLADSEQTCADLLKKHGGEEIKHGADKAQYDRNAKCARDIKSCVDSQMVLADQALLAIYYGTDIKPTPIKFSIDDNGYTMAVPTDDASNVFMYLGLERDTVLAVLERGVQEGQTE